MTTDDLAEYQQVFKGLLDLYQKEKEKNKELLNSKIGVDLSYDDYVSKDKIKPFVKAIESWADYIEKDEGCYYKGLEELAQTLEKTLNGEVTPKEEEICVKYDPLE